MLRNFSLRSLLCLALIGSLSTSMSGEAAVPVGPVAPGEAVVSTFAGNRLLGFVDGPGATSQFYNLYNVITSDAAGNIFVPNSSPERSVIRKVAPDQTVSTLTGTTFGHMDGPPGIAKLMFVRGMAVDNTGNLIVSETDNAGLMADIRKISPDGTVTTIAGSTRLQSGGIADGQGTDAHFYYPGAVAVDSHDNIFVTDGLGIRGYSQVIRKITTSGEVTTLAGSVTGPPEAIDGTGPSASFYYPAHMTIDANDNLFVAENPNGLVDSLVRRVTPTGTVTTLLGGGVYRGITADGPIADAHLFRITSLAIDSNGALLVANGDSTIRKIFAGTVTTVAGSSPGYIDGPALTAQFGTSNGLAIDPNGSLFVADPNANVIRVVTPAPIFVGDQAACWQNPIALAAVSPTYKICGNSVVANGWALNIGLNFATSNTNDAIPNGETWIVAAGLVGLFKNQQQIDEDRSIPLLAKVLSTSTTVRTLAGSYQKHDKGGVVATPIGKVDSFNRGGTIKVRVYMDLNKDGNPSSGEPYEDLDGRWRRPVAFGDSYSSGEGASHYDPASRTNTNNCHRSKIAYARQLNIKGAPGEAVASDVRLYSCSGARTFNLRSTFDPSIETSEGDQESILAVNPALNGVLPQSLGASNVGGPNPQVVASVEARQFLTATGEAIADPDYVTLGIGGNDMRFVDLLTDTCLGGCNATKPWVVPQVDALVYPGVTNLDQFVNRQIDIVMARLAATSSEVKGMYPNVPLFVVGYPMLFTRTLNGAHSVRCAVIHDQFQNSAEYFRQKQNELDYRMALVAKQVGAHYVSLIGAFEGGDHGICSDDPYINDLNIAGGDALVCKGGLAAGLAAYFCLSHLRDYQNQPISKDNLTQSAFHPNAKGQRLDAATITKYFDSWTGPRTSTGIPQNPAPNPSATVLASSSATSVAQIEVAGGPGHFAISATADPVYPAKIDVLNTRCGAAPGTDIDVKTSGLGASGVTTVNLLDVETGAILDWSNLYFDPVLGEGSTTVTVPAATPTGHGVKVAGTSPLHLDSDAVLVTNSNACAKPDNFTVTAGSTKTLNVTANDLPSVGTIGSLYPAEHGTVTLQGNTVQYRSSPTYSGVDSFSYSICDTEGCHESIVTLNVEPAACTIVSTADAAVVNGTSGDDVICVNHMIGEVRAGTGNDIIYVHAPFSSVDPGAGSDTVIPDASVLVAVASSLGSDTVETETPYIRYTNSALPADPTNGAMSPQNDTTFPTLTVTLPIPITIGIATTATITCTDNNPGVQCPSSIALDTTTVGTKTVTVTATDASANTTTTRLTYTVTPAPIDPTTVPATSSTTTTTSTTTILPSTTTSTSTTTPTTRPTTTSTTTTPTTRPASTTTKPIPTTVPAVSRSVLWASSGNADAISVTGISNVVNGLSHSNGGVRLTGSATQLIGGLEYATTFVAAGSGNIINPAAVKKPAGPVASVDLNPYKPGGAAATSGTTYKAITATQCVNNVWTINANQLPTGIVYVPCEVRVIGSAATKQTVLVATGPITIAGNNLTLTPVGSYPSILTPSTINLVGNAITINREIRAGGTINMIGINGTYGCAAGATVVLAGATNKITGACELKIP
jgi:hypothetical protein